MSEQVLNENVNTSASVKTSKLLTTKNMARIAVLSAAAVVLMYFDFPLPFFPSFYKIDFSEVVVALAAFSMGPVAGLITEALKVIIITAIKGTYTAYVGDFAAFLIGACYVVVAGVVYKKDHTQKGAIIGMVLGTLAATVAGVLANYYLLIPAYVKFAGYPLDAIIGMGTAINANITNLWTFVLLSTAPFNLFKWILDSVLVKLIYKHVSPILHR